MHTTAQLTKDLHELGIRPGDSVLMHSSYKSLGGIEGGAAGFYRAFLELLGAEGTLIVPALSYRHIHADNPEFDREHTASCVGYLTEFFRTEVPGVIRSMHATHSCCMIGKHVQYLADGHHRDDTPVGPHSPFFKLPKLGGKILFLGAHPDRNTSLHGVEETVDPPYLFDRSARIPYILRDNTGRTLSVPSFRYHFTRSDGRYRQCYGRVLTLLAPEEARRGRVLSADCWLLDARAVWKKARDKMMEDPYFFVEWTPNEGA